MGLTPQAQDREAQEMLDGTPSQRAAVKAVRLSVNLNQETAAALQYRAAKQGKSVTQIVANAIIAYDEIMKAQEAGRKVEFVDKYTRQGIEFS